MPDEIHLDYETRSPVDIRAHGIDRYSAHPETAVLMGAYSINGGPDKHFDLARGDKLPNEFRKALLDPNVLKWGFNSSFEFMITRRVLNINTPFKGWRCSMALANMQGFSGGLGEIGDQVEMPMDRKKMADGKKLIRLFCVPQKITKSNSFVWRDEFTDPDKWERFRQYNIQDNVAEKAIKRRLIKYYIPEHEWELFEIDLEINLNGFPVDLEFAARALEMANERKRQLLAEMVEYANEINPEIEVKNANSTDQLLPWLKAHGYPLDDLQKDSITKVVNEDAEHGPSGTYFLFGYRIDEHARHVLKLRQKAARQSHAKLKALVDRTGADGRYRFGFQFAGAARTGRWSGRGFQPQNLVRTPPILSPNKVSGDKMLRCVMQAIRDSSFADMAWIDDPMDVIIGSIRSAIQAPEGMVLLFSDLKSIETRVAAWVAKCIRLMNVFANDLDPYKDFATFMYKVAYEEVDSHQRQGAKPGVLGAIYGLGGGDMEDGKKTGLWGHADGMGIKLTREESHHSVRTFRQVYLEIPQTWYAMEEGAVTAVVSHRPITVNGLITFSYEKPYLVMTLPSDRRIYYFQPRVTRELRVSPRTGNTYEKLIVSYMGLDSQKGNKWTRIYTRGAKLFENAVQAIARDVLAHGMRKVYDYGFHLIGDIHDELWCLERRGDNYYDVDTLCELMSIVPPGHGGLVLGADGYAADFYRKG
jgi:DNA polymerase